MPLPSRVVVRGKFRGLDKNYACLANDGTVGNYAVLDFCNGRLTRRTLVPASDRALIESYTNENTFRGNVYVDMRSERDLLPLKWSAHCSELDLDEFRRSKSREEIRALLHLESETDELLKNVDDERAFRGARQKESDYKSAFEKRVGKGFIQYRGGFRDNMGRMVDKTRIQPTDTEWESRLQRVYRGMEHVEREIRPDVTLKHLNEIMASHLDVEKDAIFGNIVQQTGWESTEVYRGADSLREFDFVRIGAAIGAADTGDVAVVYHKCVPVENKSRGVMEDVAPVDVEPTHDEEPSPPPSVKEVREPDFETMMGLL